MGTRLYYDEWGNYIGGSTSNPMMVGYLQNPLIAGMAPSIESINHGIATDPNIQWLGRKWRAFVLWVFCLVISLLCCITFAIISCLPMWQRVCMHPSVIRLHMRRAKIAFVGGSLLLLPKLIQLITKFELPLTDLATFVGVILFPLGGATLLIGLAQQTLSQRFHYWAHGAGFGLGNLIHLATSRPPSHTWTYFQDAFLIGLLVLFCSQSHLYRQDAIILTSLLGLALLPYTWICQRKYANGSAIQLR